MRMLMTIMVALALASAPVYAAPNLKHRAPPKGKLPSVQVQAPKAQSKGQETPNAAVCVVVRVYVKLYGLPAVEKGARERGYSAAQIAAAKRCL